ncbi:MAG: DUF2062 domain-containing protein [Bacteroidales bacterium]|nr:DUF2062 domain-containing protein [Bacteroidales bacterium]
MDFSIKKIREDFNKQIKLELSNPRKLSFTIGFGVFMGIVPAWGFQMMIAFALAQLMHLNKTLVIIASNISIPPLIPFILLGSYWIGGVTMGKEGGGPLIRNLKNISDVTLEDFFDNIGKDLFQYIFGAFVLAIIMGAISYFITLFALKIKESKK